MTMVFLGDVMLGRLVNEQLKTASPAYPWGDTLPLLGTADAIFVNLECVIADRGAPRARDGAQRMLVSALEQEIEDFLGRVYFLSEKLTTFSLKS